MNIRETVPVTLAIGVQQTDVIPAKAGIHFDLDRRNMDSRFRGNDDMGIRGSDDTVARRNSSMKSRSPASDSMAAIP